MKGDAVDNHDFGGYATVANRKCSDGRTISPQAFQHMDKVKVPLVFQHLHNDPDQVLGHAILEARENGVYAYCFLNGTPRGKNTKIQVQHGDLDSLSIYANELKEHNKKVLHGQIREVSIVLAGANPDAKIDFVRVAHGDGDVEVLEDEAVIAFWEPVELAHSDSEDEEEQGGELEHKTYQEVYDTLDEDQENLLLFMVDQARKQPVEHSGTGADNDDTEQDKSVSDDTDLAHKDGKMTRVFDQNNKGAAPGSGQLMHGAGGILMAGGYNGSGLSTDQMTEFMHSVGEFGLKKAVLMHAEDYGITNIEVLFPDAKMIDARPEWITRKMEWVEGVLNGTQKLPFAKIKSRSADLTYDTARAKGYIKGTLKKEQFFTLSQRETGPKTIYKKQRLDRDDIIDITDFDVVAWFWVEMRFMLREEVARAILVADGREVDDPDKINENHIRPIAFDDPFYTDVVTVPANTTALGLIDAVLMNRYTYLGSTPTAYMTNQTMTGMLLTRDTQNRRLFRTKAELAAELMVVDIVEVPVMEGVKRDGLDLVMIIVNLSDYAVGSTKGGEITTFQDFDMDYNQEKLLIETRISGALIRHKTAQVILKGESIEATLTEPTFVSGTGVVTIPTVTGVTYKNKLTGATLSAGAQSALASGASIEVVAVPNTGYHFDHGVDTDWVYTRP